MKLMFHIRLKQSHDATGHTPYKVAKDLSMSANTVRRYVNTDVLVLDQLPIEAVKLATYYGCDWRDPAVVDVIEVEV